MKEHRIDSSAKLFQLFHNFKDNRALTFRGQRDASWKILPKAGRDNFALKYGHYGVTEKGVFEAWKRYAIHFMNRTPIDEWDWLALAQHHGLATRLLDWTKNPLNAAFFAVDSNEGLDSAVLMFEILERDLVSEPDPFNVQGFRVYRPRGLSARVLSQRGVFTISGSPTIPIEEQLGDRLHKIIIASTATRDVKQALEFFGVNKLSIYQDLDHLSEWLNDYVIAGYSPPIGVISRLEDLPLG